MKRINRRQLIYGAVAAASLPAASAKAASAIKIQRRPLGKTGMKVSILGLGGGSQFLNASKTDDEAIELVSAAIDGGINYLDSAFGYGNGESLRRYGLVVGSRRKEVFLTSKTAQRSRDGALREVDTALKNLRTDHIDVMQIHDIHPDEDLEKILAKDGVYRALLDLKRQKIVRAVGITGHASVLKMSALMDGMEELDTILFPVNPQHDSRHYLPTHEDANPEGHFKETLLPRARARGLGIIAMKSTAQGQLIGKGPGKADVSSLIRFAMGEPGVSVVIVGPGSLENLKKNLAVAQAYVPMSSPERKQLIARVSEPRRRFAFQDPQYRDR